MKVRYEPQEPEAGVVSFMAWSHEALAEAMRSAFNASPREELVQIDVKGAIVNDNNARAAIAPVTDERQLVVYAIYHNPSDYPGEYVLRPWAIERPHTDPQPGELIARGMTLNYVRSFLPPGLCCLGRNASDDAAIVEVWI